MDFFDYHTHKSKRNSCKSCTLADWQEGIKLLENQKISLQFHPWHLPERYYELPSEFVEAAKNPQIYAIGEIGLDRLKGPVFEVQKKYFEDLLELASDLHKPVILHVVRSANEVFDILKKYPDLMVVWHGFRGKKELFERIMQANIFVSLHHLMLENQDFIDYIKVNKKYCDRIGFESDDYDIEIEKLYRTFEEKINE